MVYYHLPPAPPPPSPPPRYKIHDSNCHDDSNALYRRITIHGLVDLHRAKNGYLRWFWVITFLGAAAAAFYGCYHITEQYAESSMVVSYMVQEFDVKFPLPDLVICPFNRFNAEFLKNYSISTDIAQYMQLTFGASAKYPKQREGLRKWWNTSVMIDMDVRMKETLNRMNMTFAEFLEAASLRCSDIFVDCLLPQGRVDCCDYATGMMTFAGKCYRIRGVDQVGPGYGFGMTIIASLPKSLYSLAINNWLNDGIVVKLAEPDRGVDYDLTFVPVGTHALMPLKAIQYEFVRDPPRFECLPDAPTNYSRVECFDSCFIESAQNECNCTIVTNLKTDRRQACTTLQFYGCIAAVLNIKYKLSQQDIMERYFFNCRQRCKPRCSYWQYQTSISYSKFPFQEARNFAKTEQEWTRMQNTIILDLYYEKLEFSKIKHYRAMTLHAFVANLGGQCSLWLGASVLTLIQLIVFMIEYFYSRCKRLVHSATITDVKMMQAAKMLQSTVIMNGPQAAVPTVPAKPLPRPGILRVNSNYSNPRFADTPLRTVTGSDTVTGDRYMPKCTPPPPQPPMAERNVSWNLRMKAHDARKSKTLSNCSPY